MQGLRGREWTPRRRPGGGGSGGRLEARPRLGSAATCSEPDSTAWRRRSPAEMCSQPYFSRIRAHCVPLPDLAERRAGAGLEPWTVSGQGGCREPPAAQLGPPWHSMRSRACPRRLGIPASYGLLTVPAPVCCEQHHPCWRCSRLGPTSAVLSLKGTNHPPLTRVRPARSKRSSCWMDLLENRASNVEVGGR
jgi:hypothetical protein